MLCVDCIAEALSALPYRFFPDLEWYTDVMITLIERAGEFSTKDIWHSTVQLITNNDDLHTYAATKVCALFLPSAICYFHLGDTPYHVSLDCETLLTTATSQLLRLLTFWIAQLAFSKSTAASVRSSEAVE